MKASPQLCVVLAMVLLPALCLAGPNSGESGEQKKRKDTCKHLVQEPVPVSTPPPTPSSVPTPPPGQCYCTPAPGDHGGFHSECPLIKALRNMTFELEFEEQVEWEAWIEECENSFLANSSLSDEDKVVAISISLKVFYQSHKSIHKKLHHKKIGDWGVVEDFIYVHISIKISVTQSICSLDASGSCAVLQTLQNTSDSFSADDQAKVDELSGELEQCLGDISFTYSQKLGKVFQLFKAFFKMHPQLEKPLKEAHIQGYGSLEVFLSVCETYYSIVNINVVLSGTSVDDCEFLAAWDNATQDTSLSVEYRTQLKQMKDKFQAYFQTTFDLKLRLKFVSRTCYNASLLEDWLVSVYEDIECGAEWGNVYRMIFCSGVCSIDGCDNPNQGPGPNNQAPSTAAPPASSTQKPADCSKVGSLIVVDSSNKTVLTDVLTTNYNTWTTQKKMGFNTYFNQIRLAIWNTTVSHAVKLSGCKKAFTQYSANNLTVQKEVMDIQINIWVGTIGQFCGCIPS